MAFQRGIDGSEPLRPQPVHERPGAYEDRCAARSWRLASATLACPRCDAPIALGGRALRPPDDLDCPYCEHSGAVRDFLSLATPSRPARVVVRVRLAERGARR